MQWSWPISKTRYKLSATRAQTICEQEEHYNSITKKGQKICIQNSLRPHKFASKQIWYQLFNFYNCTNLEMFKWIKNYKEKGFLLLPAFYLRWWWCCRWVQHLYFFSLFLQPKFDPGKIARFKSIPLQNHFSLSKMEKSWQGNERKNKVSFSCSLFFSIP